MNRIILALFSLTVASNLTAATITVQNTNNSGAGSLRQAISTASSGDIIEFNPSLISSGNATILLTSEITINQGIAIKGLYNNNDTLFISGNNTNRIFKCDMSLATHKTTTLDSLFLIDGHAPLTGSASARSGGAIYFAGGRLNIFNSLISNNQTNGSGGAIYSYYASVSIKKTVISNNTSSLGGGLYMTGDTSCLIENSTITRNNSTANGGGIYISNGMYLTLSKSTVAYNSSRFFGGGIFTNDVYNQRGTELYLINSTIAYNNTSSGGGIYDGGSGLKIINSTIVYNNATDKAGVYSNDPSTSVKGSIISFNGNGLTNNVDFGSSGVISLGYNIFSDAYLLGVVSSDNIFVDSSTLNLGPLQNNGGVTNTFLPLNNSLAINNGDSLDFSNAQNSAISDSRRDIGAAEAISIIPIKIACGEFYNGNTALGENNFNNYGCAPQNEYGKEQVFEFTISSQTDMDIALSNLSTDLDIHLLTDPNDPNSCITRDDNRIILSSLAPGTYYIIVDGFGTSLNNVGTYTLTLDCFQCKNPIPLTCGIQYNGTTENGQNHFNNYGCAPQNEYGKDQVFSFKLDTITNIDITLSNLSTDLDIHLLTDSCDGNSCIARDDNYIAVNNLSPGTYYIVVDGFGDSTNTVGTYTLALNCFNCSSNNSIIDSICPGDSVLFAGAYYNTTGNYYDTISLSVGCDSITHLSLLPKTNCSVNCTNVYDTIIDSICPGDSVLFAGAYYNTTGNYYDTIPLSGGCDSITSFSLIAKFNCIGNCVAVKSSLLDSVCFGDSILFMSNYYTSAGVYSDTLSRVNGCDSIVSLNLSVTNKVFVVGIADVYTIGIGGTVNFNSNGTRGANYNWNFGDNFSSTLGMVSHTYNAAGTYTVVLEGSLVGFCNGYDTLTITVLNNVGILDNNNTDFDIYPIPASNFINISNDNIVGKLSYSISGINGVLVKKGVINSNESIDVQSIKNGIYFIKLTNKSGTAYTKRIIINR